MSLPPFIKSFSADSYGETTRMLVKEPALDYVDDDEEEDLATGKGISGLSSPHPETTEDAEKGGEDPSWEGYRIDKLFYRICWITMALGVNFYRYRKWWQTTISCVIVAVAVSINFCYIAVLLYGVLKGPFDADVTVMSLGLCTATLQATLSTIFMAYWQYTKQFCVLMKQIYAADKGTGIHKHRKKLKMIVTHFYIIVSLFVLFDGFQIFADLFGYEVFWGKLLKRVTQRNHYLCGLLLANMYTLVSWTVAIYTFVLLIHATNCEFVHFNESVRKLKADGDEVLCERLIDLIKVHNRLTEVVKRLDRMFHRYAFVMIATIIPTTIFALFMLIKQANRDPLCMFYSVPIVSFCAFSFFAITHSPSLLHNSIYETKSALCSNTNIWFPYRPNVYHSALAFVCHLDQANLGISIWGFAVVSKPLILTTFSVMVTCLALFLQLGECSL